jgi:hypothetical protein
MPSGERYYRRLYTLQYNAYVVYKNSVPFKVTGEFNTPGVFKEMSMVLRDQAKKTLWSKFKEISPHKINSQGYVKYPSHNLLPGIDLKDFERELSAGSGDEQKIKFLAVHSSSALVVNTFAPFKKDPSRLNLCGVQGFRSIRFEQKLSTGLGGTPPNLDLVAENDTDVIAVESKLLEYFAPKKPSFTKSYMKARLPQAEDRWLALMESLRDSAPKYLDVAQLIKHYFGLRNTAEYTKRNKTLLYLFWEPENSSKFDIFQKHRDELNEFTHDVADTSIRFAYKSYKELWSEWIAEGIFETHVKKLQARYSIKL